jgi:hypothetical protein
MGGLPRGSPCTNENQISEQRRLRVSSVVFAANLPTDAGFPRDASRSTDEIAVHEALHVIEQLERLWDRTRWEVRSRHGKVASLDNFDAFVPDPTRHQAMTVVEPVSGRICVHSERTAQWIGGPAPFGTTSGAIAFDSRLLRKWSLIRPGLERPEEGRKGVGETGSEGTSALDDAKRDGGHGWFPPYFRGCFLSKSLKRLHEDGKPLHIDRQPDGTWQIRCFDFTRDNPDAPDTDEIVLTYDPTRSGNVTAASWYMRDKIGRPGEWKRMLVDLQQLADGTWAPRRVRVVNILSLDMNERTFSSVVRNPRVTDATFRIDFPRGIRVTDHIHKKIYMVGSGLENDQRAVQAFIAEHKLRPFAAREPDSARIGSFFFLMSLTAQP